jgi:pSer/pThr/pTyr-binding forkhead associated (FHA) protein
MIQLQILSGKMAGNLQVIRHFPFRIGRAEGCELRLSDNGVWDDHLTLQFQKQVGFIMKATRDAFVAVNDQPQLSGRLHNGDILSFGSVKIQFWIAAPRQQGLRFRELFVWMLLATITIIQISLIYRLIR